MILHEATITGDLEKCTKPGCMGHKIIILPEKQKPLSYLAMLGKGHFFSNDETYDSACPDFRKSGCASVSDDELLGIRTVFIFLLGINLMTTYILNEEGLAHLFYYYSYWGGVSSFFGLVFSQKAITDKGTY